MSAGSYSAFVGLLTSFLRPLRGRPLRGRVALPIVITIRVVSSAFSLATVANRHWVRVASTFREHTYTTVIAIIIKIVIIII